LKRSTGFPPSNLPVILDLGDKDKTKTITRIFTDWNKYADVLETTLPQCPSLPFSPSCWMMLLPFRKRTKHGSH
jgi:hypothetical protein